MSRPRTASRDRRADLLGEMHRRLATLFLNAQTRGPEELQAAATSALVAATSGLAMLDAQSAGDLGASLARTGISALVLVVDRIAETQGDEGCRAELREVARLLNDGIDALAGQPT
jgi:hypothetical protein